MYVWISSVCINCCVCISFHFILQDKIELFVNRLDSVESVLPYEYTAWVVLVLLLFCFFNLTCFVTLLRFVVCIASAARKGFLSWNVLKHLFFFAILCDSQATSTKDFLTCLGRAVKPVRPGILFCFITISILSLLSSLEGTFKQRVKVNTRCNCRTEEGQSWREHCILLLHVTVQQPKGGNSILFTTPQTCNVV